MTSNIAACVAALAGAFFLALAAALQQRGAASAPGRTTLHPALLLDLVRTPVWLAGIVAGLVGVGLQVVALGWGPLALVQPVGVTTLLFALPIGAATWGRPVTRVEMYAAAAVALGLGGLLVTLHPASAAPELDQARLTALGAMVTAVLAACVLGAFRLRRQARTILLAAGAGVAFGTTAALVEVLVHRAADHGVSVFASWLTLGAFAASALGFVLCQGAYRSGRLAIALATILVTDPLTAIGVGAFALREPVSTSFPIAMLAETTLLVTGIVILARGSQDTRRDDAAPSPVAPSVPASAPVSTAPGTARRILIGTDTYAPDVNGAARFTHRLASGLAARGHDVHVVAPSTPFHPSFRVCLLPRADVARVVAEVRPAVVHLQGHVLIGRALSGLARGEEIPLVATNHFMPENLLPYAAAPGWLERLLVAAAWRDVARVFRRARAVTARLRSRRTCSGERIRPAGNADFLRDRPGSFHAVRRPAHSWTVRVAGPADTALRRSPGRREADPRPHRRPAGRAKAYRCATG